MKQQKITLECLVRSPDVVELFEDYDNDYLYYLDGKQLALEPSLKIRSHSPSGFRHGYAGSGPSQLALAICLELYPTPIAKAVYHSFKSDFIVSLPIDKEFKEELFVPLDPLEYWNIPQLLVDLDEALEANPPTKEERAENLALQKEKEYWQKSLDREYQNILHLPGDHRFDFRTQAGGRNDSYCFIRILDPTSDDPYVTVIATDPGDDQDAGMSITNAAEALAMQVCGEFNIPLDKLRWIERYVDKPAIQAYRRGRESIEERWDSVRFTLSDNEEFINPDWKPLDQGMVGYLKSRTQNDRGHDFDHLVP